MILEFRELLHEMFNVLTTLGNKYELGDMTDPVKFELMMYWIGYTKLYRKDKVVVFS